MVQSQFMIGQNKVITLKRLKNAVADIKADDEWVNDSHTHAKYRGVCEGLDMLIQHFEEVKEEQNETN